MPETADKVFFFFFFDVDNKEVGKNKSINRENK